MHFNNIKYIGLFTVLMVCAISCKKEEVACNDVPVESGWLVLNEGLFQQNNSTLSYYNTSNQTVTQQTFFNVNNRGLGDTGNDMVQYGSKIYIAVNVSGTIEVIDANNFQLVDQVLIQENGASIQPRSLLPLNGHIYITNFNGELWKLDTTSLSISNQITVGRNPEGLDELNGKIYVANSGGLDAPNYDSTITVIDEFSGIVIDTISVIVNPSSVVCTDNELFVISRGNYAEIDPVLQKINLTSAEVEETFAFEPISMQKHNSKLYIAYKENGLDEIHLGIMNPSTGNFENPRLMENIQATTFYGFDIDEDGNILIKDANGYVNSGSVKVFDEMGVFQYEFTTGINPNRVIKIK